MTPPANRRRIGRSLLKAALSLIIIGIAGAGGPLIYKVSVWQQTPSQLASFLQMHALAKHGASQPSIPGALVQAVASALENLDRMNLRPDLPPPAFADLPPPAFAGADARRDVPRPPGALHMADSMTSLRKAVAEAQPGDVIELLSGHYVLDQTLRIVRNGSPERPIVLRAGTLGSVVIESSVVEAIKLNASDWVFENLVMRGVCADDTGCDHAFHVVGGATGSVFRNLRLEDFNAHFKINAEQGRIPDNGRIEFVTMIDNHPRDTTVPVTPIDLDVASGWRMTANFIADFARTGADLVSYGGYAKAAGSDNRFERNVVFCEWKLRSSPGQRIGLSFGGGGSDPGIRRDHAQLGYEQSGSVMQDNLIVACNDDGIYLNRSAATVVSHNTLIDTAGIDVRFPQSRAIVSANLVDGPIRARDGGTLSADGNLSTGLWSLFRGQHPLRSLFADPAHLDLRWRQLPPQATSASIDRDLCGFDRSAHQPSRPGAFDDFAACLEHDQPGQNVDRE
jgi:parallel beta-helix repeat protein